MHASEKYQSFWSRPSFAIGLLFLLALLFNWPYLKGGFVLDDVIIYNVFNRSPLPFSRWLGVWAGLDGSAFESIWWLDPDTSVAFLRPIPSLVFEGSIRLFDRNALPLHLLAILLHGGVSAGLYIFVKKLTDHHLPALLAGIFFVACEDHSMTVGWLATITDLLCVLFILIALNAHIEWLKHRKPGSLIGALAALLIALGCKETAVIAPVAMILINFFMPDGSDENNFDWNQAGIRVTRLFRDTLSWLPVVILLVAYLVFYKTVILGALNSLLYINPFEDPGLYLSHLVLHLPIMWLGTFSPVMINFTLFFPDLFTSYAVMGLAIFLAWLAALLPFRKRPLALWAFIMYIIALLPQVCTDASTRGLYFPLIPASILIVLVTMTIGPIASRLDHKLQVRSRWSKFMGWMAIVGILIPGISISITGPFILRSGLEQPEKEFRTALPHIEERQYDHVLLLNGSGFMQCLYAGNYMNYLSDEPQNASFLSAAYGVFSLEKTGDTSFVIRTDRKGWLSNFVAKVIRTDPVMRQGRVYENEIFDSTILEITEDASDTLAVEFDFKIPLDDPGLLFLRWNGDEFEPLDISMLEVGETAELADTSDFWGSD